jgi:hypothetical protein
MNDQIDRLTAMFNALQGLSRVDCARLLKEAAHLHNCRDELVSELERTQDEWRSIKVLNGESLPSGREKGPG